MSLLFKLFLFVTKVLKADVSINYLIILEKKVSLKKSYYATTVSVFSIYDQTYNNYNLLPFHYNYELFMVLVYP